MWQISGNNVVLNNTTELLFIKCNVQSSRCTLSKERWETPTRTFTKKGTNDAMASEKYFSFQIHIFTFRKVELYGYN